jgi:hypothetical protein
MSVRVPRLRSRSSTLRKRGLAPHDYEAPDFTHVPTGIVLQERAAVRRAYARALAASDKRSCAAAARVLLVLDHELAVRGIR